MSELRVGSFGEAQDLVNKFNQAAADLQGLISFCTTTGASLEGIWEGASSQNLQEFLAESTAALQKMVPVVEELQTDGNARLEALIIANQ